jgi:hypothetical protein
MQSDPVEKDELAGIGAWTWLDVAEMRQWPLCRCAMCIAVTGRDRKGVSIGNWTQGSILLWDESS